MMRHRVMCVWLPQWPLQRRFLRRPKLRKEAVVVHTAGKRGSQVLLCTKGARRLGVVPGMPLAEAMAMLERTASQGRSSDRSPCIEEHDPEADQNVLRALARWCHRYTPLVSVEKGDSPECLFLEVAGCAHLFGGEKRFALGVEQTFRERGLVVRIALADTPGAAWAFSHFGSGKKLLVIPPGQHPEALRALPVEALRLPRDIVRTLGELDIGTIGKLGELPRESLPSRFGEVVTRRLDQAVGNAPEVLTPEPHLEPLESHWSFDDATADRRILEQVSAELLKRVISQLPAHHGLERLLFTFTTRARDRVVVEIGVMRPTVSLGHLRELLQLNLERLTLPSEITEIRLKATVTDRLLAHQGRLFSADEDCGTTKELAIFLNRLMGRLGKNAVLRPVLVDDHQPERAVRGEPVERATLQGQAPAGPEMSCSRPLRLKPEPLSIEVLSLVPEGPPVRFHFQGKAHRVTRHWGPERIETGWWRTADVARDYYRVETESGHQYWLFRQRSTGAWYLHGAFD